MDDKELISTWRNRCIRQRCTPIALVCVDKNGFPVVYSQHDQKLLATVWKHLGSAPPIQESGHLEGQEY
jgi:hypothetical protein